jgi:hypothetical protein
MRESAHQRMAHNKERDWAQKELNLGTKKMFHFLGYKKN